MEEIRKLKQTIDNLINEKQNNTGKIQNLEAMIKRQELMVEMLQTKMLSKQSFKQHLIFPKSATNASLASIKDATISKEPNAETAYYELAGDLKKQLHEIDKQIHTQKAAISHALYTVQC
jgi:hypothetical protein